MTTSEDRSDPETASRGELKLTAMVGATHGREETPEGDVEEVELDRNGNEIEEDKEGEITK